VANRFYSPGVGRSAKVQTLFATIASRYDLINDIQSFGLHRRWKRRVVQLAAVGLGDRALDVCCGTGDIALELARCGARVTGLDFSRPMLEVARRRSQAVECSSQSQENRSQTETVQFMLGDATQLPFPDETFDIITIGYGLRNLTKWEVGLTEMARVAGPGARLLVLDFGKPDNALWRTLYFGYLRLFVPMLGLVFCGNASAYADILESLNHYPAQRGVEAKMINLGLIDVRVTNLLGGAMSINYGRKPQN